MLQQDEHSIRDGSRHVPRACMKEKHTVRENFVFAERRFVCFYRQAAPNDVVGEVLSPSDNHRPDVRADRFKALNRLLCLQNRLITHTSRRRETLEPVAPFDELCPISVGQSQ